MDNSLGVRGFQCGGDLNSEIEHRFQVKRLAHDFLAQGLAFQQLHSNERMTIGLVYLEYSADIGMVEC